MAEFKCEFCSGTSWCGRPCIYDPKKSNIRLFHPDGRLKTLHERGVGFADPLLAQPKVAPMTAKKTRLRLAAIQRELADKGVTKNTPVTEIPRVTEITSPSVTENPAISVTAKKRGRPKASGQSSAERMRKLRAKRKK